LLAYLESHKTEFDSCDCRALLPRYPVLLYYARAAEQLVEAPHNFTNLHIRAYDPACSNPREGMERAAQALARIHEEMSDDERLQLFERDVYYRGLNPNFLDNITTLLEGWKLHDRVSSAPETVLSELPE
jgi:hypothetical protein